MYTEADLKDLTNNLRSLEYISIFEVLSEQYTSSHNLEQVIKDMASNRIGGLHKENNKWGSIYHALFCEFNNLPLLLGKITDGCEDIISWRLSKGI